MKAYICDKLTSAVSDSSLKWSDPVHFLKSGGKFFFVISMYPFLHIFDI